MVMQSAAIGGIFAGLNISVEWGRTGSRMAVVVHPCDLVCRCPVLRFTPSHGHLQCNHCELLKTVNTRLCRHHLTDAIADGSDYFAHYLVNHDIELNLRSLLSVTERWNLFIYLYSPSRSRNKTKQQRKHKYRYNSSKQYVTVSLVFNTIKL